MSRSRALLPLLLALAVSTVARAAGEPGARTEAHVQTIPLTGAPTAIALGAGSVWVIVGDATGDEVVRLNPTTGAVRASLQLTEVGHENAGLAARGDDVWAGVGAFLYRIDATNAAVIARVDVGAEITSILATNTAVWLTRASGTLGQLVRVNPRSGRVEARATMGGGPLSTAAAFGSIWVANSSPSSVMQVNPRTNRVVQTLLTGRFSSSLTATRGLLWVAGERTLIGLDAGGAIARRIRLPRTVNDIATSHGHLWGTDEYGSSTGRLLEIDPARGRIVSTITVGPTPVALAAGQSAVWVANFNGPSITRITER